MRECRRRLRKADQAEEGGLGETSNVSFFFIFFLFVFRLAQSVFLMDGDVFSAAQRVGNVV